jgi:pyroglutamyl-peptidase
MVQCATLASAGSKYTRDASEGGMVAQSQYQKRILITAFEPFDGRTKNASAEAAAALIKEETPANIEIVICLLPVETGTASKLIQIAMDEHQPDYVISLGEAKRDAICIEMTAYNERSFTIPDNTGLLLKSSPVLKDGPASYSATLPVEAMLYGIEQAGIAARLSYDAGRYLCNEVMYSALHAAQERDRLVSVGFIHVPHLPEAAADTAYPAMPTQEVVRALLAVLTVLSKHPGNETKAQMPKISGTQSE